MMKQPSSQRIGLLFFITIVLLLIADMQTFAQKKDYKPGEKIEYLAETYPKEVWKEGVFVRPNSDGRQPIIRQEPNEFNKGGFETGTEWEKIRPLGTKKTTTVNNKQKTENTENDPTTIGTTKNFGSGLLTQAEILSFAQARPADKNELVEMIKERGLDFRFETNSDFYSKLNKYVAMTSDVSFPLRYNYGEPTRESWLAGAWQLSKTGAAVDYEKNNRVYRQGEIAVGGIGALTIKADGTYVWKTTAKDSTSGKWRKATKEEMREQGGDGIVLLKAKGGEDWIVMQDRETTLKGNWINVSQLNWRQIKERGWRAVK